MKCYYVPQYINRNNILWWDKEEIRFIFAPFIILGIFLGLFLLGIILSSIIGIILIKARKNRPYGYIRHLQYFYTGKNTIDIESHTTISNLILNKKSFPPGGIRLING